MIKSLNDGNDEKKQTIDSNSYLPNKNKNLNFKQVFIETSWKNRSFLAVSQAGLVNNLVFGVSWGLFTLYFVSFGISVNDTAFLKALHPGVWGFSPPAGRRVAGRRGPDARQRLPGRGQQPGDHPGHQQDRPAQRPARRV